MDNIRDIRSAPSYGKRPEYTGGDSKVVEFPRKKDTTEQLQDILNHPHLLEAIKKYHPEDHPAITGAPEHFEFAKKALPKVWEKISQGVDIDPPDEGLHPFLKRQHNQNAYMYHLLGAIINHDVLDHLESIPVHKSFASPFPFARFPK